VATRSAGVAGYVSEAGVSGAPHGALYRASVWAIALALALLAMAVRRADLAGVPGADAHAGRAGTRAGLADVPGGVAHAGRAGTSAAALALAAASPFAALSGAVRCSAGCPLPPYERATAADLVHGAASVAALVLCAAGIVLLAARAADPWLRRVSTAGVVVAVPLLGGAGLGLVFAGRGAVTGVLERAALLAVLAWLVATAGRLAAAREPAGR
jgi:hypothetical protein